jgi:hypothetical protein
MCGGGFLEAASWLAHGTCHFDKFDRSIFINLARSTSTVLPPSGVGPDRVSCPGLTRAAIIFERKLVGEEDGLPNDSLNLAPQSDTRRNRPGNRQNGWPVMPFRHAVRALPVQ